MHGYSFVDLKNAFDTVHHDILLGKHSQYGTKNNEHKCPIWRIGCSAVASNVEKITCGVPQESCIGPLLLLLYNNDLPFALNCSKVTMYADDTSLAHSAKDVKDNQYHER